LVFFLASLSLVAAEITEEELARLEAIFTELQQQNNELQLSVTDLESSLQKVEISLRESENERIKIEQNRDCWRHTAFVFLGMDIAGILAIILWRIIGGD